MTLEFLRETGWRNYVATARVSTASGSTISIVSALHGELTMPMKSKLRTITRPGLAA